MIHKKKKSKKSHPLGWSDGDLSSTEKIHEILEGEGWGFKITILTRILHTTINEHFKNESAENFIDYLATVLKELDRLRLLAPSESRAQGLEQVFELGK